MGYPPFLKQLIDTAERQGFPLADYRLNALVGGEGMSEGLRDYLLHSFRKVYSGYGATDLEIGIAGETPLSVAIRRLARDDAKVRQNLFGGDSRLPMLFQYNPLMHYVEINADFREAWHEYPETMIPEIHLHRLGEGPFRADAGRIKQVRQIENDT